MSIRSGLISTFRRLWAAGPGPSARGRARALAAGGLLSQARLIGDMGSITSGPDQFIRGGMKEWRAKARWLSATNPYAKKAKHALQTNLIGHRGIRMRANVLVEDAPSSATLRTDLWRALERSDNTRAARGRILAALEELRRREKDESRCQALETEWAKFCRADSFDMGGRLSFHGYQVMIAGSFPGAGGCMVRALPFAAGKSRVPLCFELLPMDRLNDDMRGPSRLAGRHWRDGIEFDTSTGRRTGYAILTDHPGEVDRPGWALNRRKWTYVPAEQIAHIFIPEEIGQTREVPWLLPVLTTIHSISEYEKSHWTRKRVVNNTLGFIEEEEGEFITNDVVSDEEETEAEPDTMELLERSSPGQYIKLRAGEKVVQPQFGPDDNSFEAVLKTMLRRFAAGLSMSYATVSRDFGDTNWATIRQSVLEDRDEWRVGQAILSEQFCQWAYEKWVEAAVLAGVLPMALFGDYLTNPDRYLCPVWQPRSWQWVDPLKEIKALELAQKVNLQTLAEQIAETSSEDLETVLVQRAYEVELMKALGLDAAPEPSGGPGGPEDEDEA